MRTFIATPLIALLVSCASSRSVPEPSTRAAHVVTELRRFVALDLEGAVVTPERASTALRVGDGDAFLEVSPRGAHDVAKTTVSGASVYLDALDDTDLVYARAGTAIEDLRVARTLAAAAHPMWDLRTGPAIARIEVHDGRVQAIDARGAVRISSAPAWAIDANGVKRSVTFALHGNTLEGTVDVEGLTAPVTIDPAWTVLATMTSVRFRAAAVRLASGKVLVAGGGSPAPLTTAELYDPVANTWTATKGGMAYSHENIVGTAFASNTKVLLSGGSSFPAGSIAEIYDSVTDTFTQTTMPVASRDHTQTLLADGKIALIGGQAGLSDNTTVRTYNPATGGWTNGPSLFFAINHAALLLPSGSVLVTGGYSRPFGTPPPPLKMSDGAQIYDPVAGTFTKMANLPTGRINHAMVRLTAGPAAGKIMVFAGQVKSADETSPIASGGAALYDLATDTWTKGPFLHSPRIFFGWSELAGGRILVTGGASDFSSSVILPFAEAELYDPTANAWLAAGKMSTPRGAHVQVTLASGNDVLVGGGLASVNEGFFEGAPTSEKFTLQANGGACDAPGECSSGFCVDGVCCDTACTAQCAACDVTGKVGTCSVVTGVPHGARTPCDPTKSGSVCAAACDGTDTAACHFPGTTVACGANGCAGGVETHTSTCDGAGKCADAPKSCGDLVCDATACKTTCATKADCVNPSHFCEAGKCIPQQANGFACTRDEACASGNCIDGTCCESKCDGQCQACDVPGQAGKCVAVQGKPHGKRPACAADTNACGSKICDGSNTASCAGVPACGNYGCDKETLVCKSACTSGADCATGFDCKDAACVPQTSKCSNDLTQVLATDGSKIDCAPYLCRDGGCVTSCKSSNDCQGGFVCGADQKCVAPEPAADTGGGCSYGAPSRPLSGFLLALLIAAIASRRLKS